MGNEKQALATGALRREAFSYLTREERMKYEIARELGLMVRVREVGWAGLSAKETGRIGGLIARRKHASPAAKPDGESARKYQ